MLIGKDWYERVGNYQEGFASVKKNGKWYFIDKEGRLLNKRGYYFVMDFVRGTAVVEQANKYNLIDEDLSKDIILDYLEIIIIQHIYSGTKKMNILIKMLAYSSALQLI